MGFWERVALAVAPRLTLQRAQARKAATALLARNYEAASRGRRTSGWARTRGDANAILARALPELRMHARDLVRNNGWARKAQRVIANNTTGGWGLTPRALGPEAVKAREIWTKWADASTCDAEALRSFSAIQHQVVRTLATDGEVLIRRRRRRPEDGLPLPLQIQLLEADYLDSAKDGVRGTAGGPIIQGVEFDAIGRRVAYWLFPEHPGSSRATAESKRVPAEDVIHVFDPERPGQVRGVSWYGAGIVPLKDLDEYEDAELMKQKIAACFAAFVTDIDGTSTPMGAQDARHPMIETIEPGMVHHLRAGQDVTFGSPPQVVTDTFTARNLRRIAAALGVTYEDLTGDYSQVNFSSARMSRIAHWGNVRHWQWNVLVPQLCAGVWAWAMEAAVLAGAIRNADGAEWTAPPMPMIEPDKEGLAYSRLVRNGVMTFSDMIREQGGDPETHLAEYAEDLKRLDAAGIVLDSDVRKVSAAGLTQERVGGAQQKKAEETEERILALAEGLLRGE